MKRLLPTLVALSMLLTSCASSAAAVKKPLLPPKPTSSSTSSAPAAMKREPPKMMMVKKSSSSSSKKSSSSAAAAMKITWNLAAAKQAMPKTEAEWKKKLTDDQYAVLWLGGTEQPYTSPLVDEHRKGTFYSLDCDEPVFRSEQKFDSGTGWPSFWAPITPDALIEKQDTTGGLVRTEVTTKCGGHLGHVFTDGPKPTGLRYCMNGLALRFVPDAVQ